MNNQDSTSQSLRESLGLPRPEEVFTDDKAPRPVDIEQIRDYHAGKLSGALQDEVCELLIAYRDWHEAGMQILKDESKYLSDAQSEQALLLDEHYVQSNIPESPTLLASDNTARISSHSRSMKWLAIFSTTATTICLAIIIWQQREIKQNEIAITRHEAIEQAMRIENEAQAMLPNALLTKEGLEQLTNKYESAIKLLQKADVTVHPVSRDILLGLENIYSERHETLEKARQTVIEVLNLERELYGEKSPAVSNTLRRYAHLEERYGNHPAAINAMKDAIEIINDREVPGSQEYMTALGVLAAMYETAGELKNSVQIYQTLINLENDKERLALHLFKLAENQLALGESDSAIQNYHKGLAIQRELKVPPSSLALLTLGRELRKKGEISEANALLTEALENYWSASNDLYPTILMDLAHIRGLEGRFQEALDLKLQALNLYKIRNETRSQNYVIMLNNATNSCVTLGYLEQAAKFNKQAFETYEKLNAPEKKGLSRANLLVMKSMIEDASGHIDNAFATAKEAVTVAQNETPEDDDAAFVSHSNLASLLLKLNMIDSAEAALKVAYARIPKEKSKNPIIRSSMLGTSALLALKRGKYQKAIEDLEEAITICPEQCPYKTLAQTNLIAVYNEMNRIEDARMLAMTIKESLSKLISPKVQEENKGKILIIEGFPTLIPTL